VIFASLIAGALTAYWFGLRIGAWAAALTFALCLLAAVIPAFSTPIYVLLAAGAGCVCIVGPQRERPADAVRAVNLVRAAIGHATSRLRRSAPSKRNEPDGEP
jgi:hypothetical protein